jgi:hypothetical protein
MNSEVPKGRPVCVHRRMAASSASHSPVLRYSSELLAAQAVRSARDNHQMHVVEHQEQRQAIEPAVSSQEIEVHGALIVGDEQEARFRAALRGGEG